MHIIEENSFENLHAPFHEMVRRWYGAGGNTGLYPLENFLANSKDPLEEYRMLSNISSDPLHVEYYQVSKKLEDLYGDKIEGKNLEELYNNFFRKRAYEGYRQMIDARLPIYEQRTISTIIGKIGYYKIHLPFGEGEEVKSGATYIMPTSESFRRRFDWEKLIKKTPWM